MGQHDSIGSQMSFYFLLDFSSDYKNVFEGFSSLSAKKGGSLNISFSAG